MARRLVILGSTGSIGRQALDVIRRSSGRWEVVGLAAGSNTSLLAQQVKEFRPRAVAVADHHVAKKLSALLDRVSVEVVWGHEGMTYLAVMPEADMVLSAICGAAGLVPTYQAILAGKDIALANKETLVAAGEPVMEAVRRKGVRLIPVDSEHSGIFQCLHGQKREAVRRVILTASGGPFRGKRREELAGVTPQEALRHPTWSMGPRITIDSATLMNKGLEVIEAHWLFGIPYNQIDVLIHPESIIHAMIEMEDGSVIAQMSRPDMRIPIQYALSYPDRLPTGLEPLDLARVASLHFEPVDRDLFPCLDLAYQAGRTGGTLPAVMNAAKEEAVEAFLAGRLGFLGIDRVIRAVMDRHVPRSRPTIEEILQADNEARNEARREVERVVQQC